MISVKGRSLRILLVGKGGREHALAWKLTKSHSVKHVFVVPGNGGTESLSKASNIHHVSPNDYNGLVSLAKELSINLVVAGPDDVVVDGIEGYFRDTGIPCFAPSKEAAEVEGSKTYAKDLMRKYGVPTAGYRTFTDYKNARAYLQDVQHRVVIKVDGLASGKGVILPTSQAEALQALEDIMIGRHFGPAGDSVVIEEYLEGDEISVLTFSDGHTFMSFPPAQDHKRIYDGNKGPNTGGMGVYAPLPFITGEDMATIHDTILKPTFEGLKAEGRPFVGMLFTGIMMTASGPKVIEYNARFGDPETQTLMLLVDDDDFAAALLACATGTLQEAGVRALSGYACNVVVASGGYPATCRTGIPIELGPCPEGVQIFHAGTVRVNGQLRTAGGRVFSVAAFGKTLEQAVAAAYGGVRSIKFEGMYYRMDIAARCL